MKISNFAVNNYRGITGGLENNRIDFNGINTLFIFGQNNTGKSTFLKAYDVFYSDDTPSLQDFHRQDHDCLIQIEIEVKLDTWDRKRIESAAPKARDSYKEYLIDDCRLRLRNEWVFDGKKANKRALTWSPKEKDFVEKGYASVGLHSVFQSCLPKPIFIKAMPNEQEAKDILNEILKSVAESRLKETELQELENARQKIKELQEKMYNKDVIKEYQDSANEYMKELFPTIRMGFEDKKDRVMWTENKLGREYDISFQNVKTDGEIDSELPSHVAHIGHGAIRSAIFTLLLMRDIAEEFERIDGRKDYLVLFEEPELFLYPKVIRELRELIYTVSAGNTPYQVLCASHSPSMVDISKLKSSIVRLVKTNASTQLYQVSDSFLKYASGTSTDKEFKQEMYEVLRFNPYICEAFYADEVILVEGPTEEIILRAYLQEIPQTKFFFILNCGTVTNIPFYQKVLSQFSIPYSVICDTDKAKISGHDKANNPQLDSGIQKSISDLFHADVTIGKAHVFRCHKTTFEPAHQDMVVPSHLRMPAPSSNGKPYDANKYWKDVLHPNMSDPQIDAVPIVSAMRAITS
ncbi:ATP-dependent endonuclease [Pseudomonadota bacterium]